MPPEGNEAAGRSPRRPPVVVLAPGNFLAPLAVMRTLRPLGARVHAPATRAMSIWKLSRHCASLLQVGEDGAPSRTDPEGTVGELLAAGRALGGDAVLMPCSDEWALFVARYADRLSQCFRFGRLDHELARQLGDKHLLHSLATSRGVGTPASVRPVDRADAMGLAPTLEYPVVVKTATTRSAGNQLVVVASPSDLVAAFDRLADPGNLICQRFVRGGQADGWLFNGYFDDQSRCIARFSGHKLRQWPAGLGITVLAEAKRNPEIEEIAIRFLSSIGYRGAVDLDFIRDSGDGEYKLLDFNPRLGGVFRLFVDRRGLDVARAMYLDLIGEHVGQEGQCENRRLVHEAAYTVATLKLLRAGQTTPWAAVRELGGAEMGLFRLTDPIPFLVQMGGMIKVHGEARLQRWFGHGRRRNTPVPGTVIGKTGPA